MGLICVVSPVELRSAEVWFRPHGPFRFLYQYRSNVILNAVSCNELTG